MTRRKAPIRWGDETHEDVGALANAMLGFLLNEIAARDLGTAKQGRRTYRFRIRVQVTDRNGRNIP